MSATDQCFVDLLLPAVGKAIPQQHGYLLYTAVSRIVPAVHQSKQFGIFPIRSMAVGNGTLRLHDRSYVRIRTPLDRLPELLALAGKKLDLGGHFVRLGVPRVAALAPAATLASSLVLIKLARPPGEHDRPPKVTPERFLDAARKQLRELEIQAEPSIPLITAGPRAGQPRRRILRVKEQTHAGYALIVQNLTAEESLRLQSHGLGGRRLMGCGLFLTGRRW